MSQTATAKRRAAQVVRRLKAEYPQVECALVHHSPLQLLVATILSAQCTDERVNLVTPALFKKYPTAADLAAALLADLEAAVKTTGFFRNKAKNIRACCQRLQDEYDGEVPQSLETLVQLPGVGRKTANVVLGTAFGLPTGVVVDTHVTRLSRRLGLTRHNDAVKIERDLIALLPRREWIDFSHRLIHHGRRVCKARKPLCDACVLVSLCPQIGVTVARGKAADGKPVAKKRPSRRAKTTLTT
jgi:endonuclease-3